MLTAQQVSGAVMTTSIIYLFIVVMITPDGHLTRITQKVKSCPDKDAVVAQFNAWQDKGEIKEWTAFCLPVVKPIEASQ